MILSLYLQVIHSQLKLIKLNLRILRYSGEPKVRGWELSAPDVGIKEFHCREVYMAEPSENICHFYYHPVPMVLNNAINEVFLIKKFFVSLSLKQLVKLVLFLFHICI